ncbi:MAG: hypothetical protein BroJett030_21340 [Alphaproteobacteria bacterium]|nr:MAG: hypothetical protein BroJett030_21340 [Alphaproteobacteria bacterium]
MTQRAARGARSDRLAQALRANLRRRKQEAGLARDEAAAVERRDDPLAPRIDCGSPTDRAAAPGKRDRADTIEKAGPLR